MSGQRHDLFVNCINDPLGLGEEHVIELEARSDPVSGTNNGYRAIEVIKCHFGNVGSHISHYRVSLASVTNEDDLTGLLNRLDNLLVVEGNDGTGVDDLCGNAFLPLIYGWVADNFDLRMGYWVLVPCFLYLIFYAAVGHRIEHWTPKKK